MDNITQYKEKFPEDYKKLQDAQQNDPDSVISSFESVDDAVTVQYYKEALKKDTDLDFVDFYRKFNPTGKYASPQNFVANYSGNENITELSDGKVADRMYNNLELMKNQLDIASDLNVKEYGDFIFQQVPRYIDSDGGFGEYTMAKPYTRGELTELTGSLTGREDDALPTRGIRSIMSLGLKREKALGYLQEYVYEGYRKSGGEISEADREVVNNNKFLRQNYKTGELEFYNPKADKYQLVNVAGLDSGDILSFTGDFIKLITETAGGVTGLMGGAFIGGMTNPVVGGAAALYGAYRMSKAGSYAGELVRAGVGNLFFPGLNPEITSMKGIQEILGDEEIQNNAQMAAYFGAFGPVADKMIKTIKGAISAGRLLTKKDFSKMAGDAEEAQIIADKINQGIADSKLLQKGMPEEFYFGVGEATRDPETLMYLNNLYEHDSAFRTALNAKDKANRDLLLKYYTSIGDTFTYAKLTGKADVAPGSVVREINKIISDSLNSKIGKQEQKILLGSKKSLDESIAELPNQGVIVQGGYIRTSIGNAQRALEKEFNKKFDGMMETAKDVQFDTKIIQDVFKQVSNREKQTLFKNSLPISKMFNIKDTQKTIDGKTLIQTIQDLKAFDRKVRTGVVAGDASEASIQRLIGALQDAMGSTEGKAAKGVYQTFRSLNKKYYNAKKALNNTLGDLVAIKNGRVKIQDSDLFETSFTARTKGYKERIDEIYEVLKKDEDHINTYKNNILNFYRKEVVKPDGTVDVKKHQQFVSDTDKGGYGYGLKKFFGEDFNEIKKIGGLQKKINEETLKLENLKKELLETSEGKLQSLNSNSIIRSFLSGDDPKYVKDIMKVLGSNPAVKNKVKASMADYIQNEITDDFGNFTLDKFNKFFKTTSGFKGTIDKTITSKKHSPFEMVKEVFKDDPQYVEGLETIHKAVTIMARRDTDAIKPGARISALMHMLRTKVGLFTPEGRALTAVLRLTEKANQKSFANLLSNKDAVKKIAQLNRIIIPKNLTDDNKINNFLKKNKVYSSFISQFLGDVSDRKGPVDLQEPDEMNTIDGKPVMPKPDINEQLNITLNTTDPNVDLFNTVNLPPAPENKEPIKEQVAQTEAPAPAPVSSGIGALNPQAQAANYAGLFPEDNLGQAIANQGVRRG
jgi:hypothetical protein|tara:strand:+ start:1687 stop:5124 length:3438 start_codon:yes stop_codon:yes gene_type:complete